MDLQGTLIGAIVILLLVVVILGLTQSPIQIFNVQSFGTSVLGISASLVVVKGGAPGFSLVLRPRPIGSTVRVWNASSSDIVILNDNLGNDTVSIGTSSDGICGANTSVICVNTDGLSQGTGPTGSWLCTPEAAMS